METLDAHAPDYRVVRLWSMRGSAAWTTLAGIASIVMFFSTMFLALALWVGVDRGIQIMRGKAEFAGAGFGKGVLTVLVLTVILCASAKVIGRRKSLRKAEAEQTGPSAAYASACLTAPEGVANMSGEEAAKWLSEFRRLSPDVLIVDPRVAVAIGKHPLGTTRDSLTIGGVPPRIAQFGVVLLMVAMLGLFWVNAEGWLDFTISVTMDVILGAGTIALVEHARQSRLGGNRTIRAGEFIHGESRWTPDDSVMTVRRFGFSGLAWYRFTLIGKTGVTFWWVRDRLGSEETIREALALWVTRRGASIGDAR